MQADSLSPLAKELFTRLDAVLASAGPAARQMFEWTVRQVQIQAVINIGIAVVFAGLCVWGHRLCKNKRAEEGDDPWLVFMVILTVIAVSSLLLGFGTNLSGLINPEYEAVRNLLFLAK